MPQALAGSRVVAICTGAVLAGTRYLGEWQTRLTTLLTAQSTHADADHGEEAPIVRVYRLARTQYVRDPRTGERSGKPRDVLAGEIDPFLLA